LTTRRHASSSDRDRAAISTRSAFVRLTGNLCRTTRIREIVDVFELTSRAAAALTERRVMNGLAESIAIRISTSDTDNGSSPGYKLRFASHPLPDDLVLETNGTRVFLASRLAEPLGGSVLDVVDTPKGPHLVLKRRPPKQR
jgi:Fe-S cluster assembly iron-binding protein IscA